MPGSQTVRIVKDRTTEVGFGLQRIVTPGAIEGDVKDAASGAALAGMHVVVPLIDEPHIANANTALHALTNTSGHYRIDGVPAGGRKAVAYGQEYIPAAETVTVAPGQTAQLDFALVKRPSDATQTVTVAVDIRNERKRHNQTDDEPVRDQQRRQELGEIRMKCRVPSAE